MFAIVGAAVVLFVTEWLRFDLVAVLVLVALALAGLVPAAEAIQGFGSPAVVTVAGVLVLSGGLYRTGVANLVGAQVMRWAGDSPLRLIALLMLTAGLLSGIMNNIAVTALLLPVALQISRRLRLPASRLLIPLAWASLLGGMTTLIGTAPNILISGAAGAAGLEPFGMFAFAPVGIAVLLAGIVYMALVGRRLLPARRGEGDEEAATVDLRGVQELQERLFTLELPDDSGLAGRTLVESRLGLALGLNVLAVRRDRRWIRAPGTDFRLRGGDVIVVAGEPGPVSDLREWGQLMDPGAAHPATSDLVSDSMRLAELVVGSDSSLGGLTIFESDFRNRFRAHVVAVRRGPAVRRSKIQATVLEPGDVLVVLAREDQLAQLRYAPEFSEIRSLTAEQTARRYHLERWLLRFEVPAGSKLAGMSLERTRLLEAFDLTVLRILREEGGTMVPSASDQLREGDVLLVEGRESDYAVLTALQDLEIQPQAPPLAELESEGVGFAEVTLAPRATLVGKTLREIFFREKYGLTVLAIWRGGRSVRSNVEVRSLKLKFGDALLVWGERSKLRLLAADPGFLVLAEEMREVFRVGRAPIAIAIMAAVFVAVTTGLTEIYVAAPAGALLMVFTGCLTSDEVYGFIQPKVIVLIGGMLALGLALERTGAAELIARDLIGRAAAGGSVMLIASLFLLCVAAAQFVPTAAVAVLMAPIALSSAAEAAVSPYALLMVVAIGSSCAFLSPFGHAVNLLVMGLGGYKVTDYTRVGAPLVIILLLIVVFFLPLIWPLSG